MEKSRKKVYFEWMRVLACGLVIFNHLGGYTLYMISTGVKQGFYMSLTMLTRINVPLFFMISGALLLGKKENYVTVIKNRISRFCLVIFIFELGLYVEYYLNALRKGWGSDFAVKQFVRGMLAGKVSGTESYWYLYTYLGFLFMLPFLQRVAREMKKQDFYILVFLQFVFSSLVPLLNIALQIMGKNEISITGDFSIPFVSAKALFYPLIGYYLEYYIDIKSLSKKKLGGICLIGGIGVLLSCLCTFYKGETTGTYTQNYVQLFDYLIAIAVFVLVKYIVTVSIPKLSEGKIAGMICLIGSLTFGIYLLDPYLKYILYNKYEMYAEPYLPTLIVSMGWCVISMTFGGILTFVLKKLPIFRKIL